MMRGGEGKPAVSEEISKVEQSCENTYPETFLLLDLCVNKRKASIAVLFFGFTRNKIVFFLFLLMHNQRETPVDLTNFQNKCTRFEVLARFLSNLYYLASSFPDWWWTT